MKRIISLIISITLLLSLILSITSCNGPKTPEEAHEILYNWLIDNGELENGTTVCYRSDKYVISADASQNITITYTAGKTDGYEASYTLPLLSNEKKVTLRMTLTDSKDTYVFGCIHTPESYRKNTPLSYKEISTPDLITINADDYGSTQYKDGKYVFTLDPDKAEEYYELKERNENIRKGIDKAEETAIANSHSALEEILGWIENNVCESAGLTLSDLGYKAYK